ncbi:glycosyl hydrolase [Geofilum rhodophaeum]|uniref:glycosyl hydrolase n=1 Tax=Geofilum rhodophaeum TaxID=1965019 RepID=UPI000B5227B4|nr:glycosyl hydrolase [Geofilum rhodophaeum]
MRWNNFYPSVFRCSGFVLVLWLLSSASLQSAVPVEELVQITESRVLDQALELHITSETTPFAAGVDVSLNHEDAWVVFENIKPSEVVANFLGQVKVQGSPFYDGVNGRVAIFAHGTVLMPHSASYEPLTVFTSAYFDGETKSFSLHTHHNQLGDFDNAIRSFKLKRGYQATLATNSDGSGYSRVFIADKEDLEFEVMPDFLDGNVSFIRVFKHQWVTKKGWAGWNAGEYQMVNATWYYDWNAEGATSHDQEYAVIRQNGGWPSWDLINNKADVSNLLGFNEPDRPDQSNLTFDQALAMWPQFMASGLRLGAPATSDPFNNWSLFNFIDHCDELNYRVDFVAIHAYWAKSAQQWYNDLKYIHERTGRPIWITEWNNGANWTNEWWPDDSRAYTDANAQKQLNDLKAILTVLDTTSFIERYSIYNWVEDARAVVLNGELTLAGEYYASNKSEVAYDSRFEVIPGYTFVAPTLSISYHRSTSSMRLAWSNPNGDLVKAYRLERSINGSSFSPVYESENLGTLSFLDPIGDMVAGTIRYRMGVQTSNDAWLYSDEVLYMKTAGTGAVEGGLFPILDSDWSQLVFSETYPSVPLAFLGVPRFKSVMPLTVRIGTTTTSNLQYKVESWNYYRNPNFAGGDSLALLSLPAGDYSFGGLQGEVGQVGRVKREWFPVVFERTFDEAPLVFVTQASNGSPFPTALAIRNISTTGFEVRLKSEEAVTAATLGELVNYLAIERGQGAIGSFRMVAADTGADGAVTTDLIKVATDEGFSRPVIFGSFQTDNNSFASTLRYYPTEGSPEFNLFRQRELSGGASVVQADEVAWMIMDLAPGQNVAVANRAVGADLKFFPNPVKDQLFVNSLHPIEVSVFSTTGVLVKRQMVQQSLNVGDLPPGNYVIRAEGITHQMVKW